MITQPQSLTVRLIVDEQVADTLSQEVLVEARRYLDDHSLNSDFAVACRSVFATVG